MRKLLLAVAVCATACAPKIVPTPVVTDEKYPQFRQPAIPASLATTPAGLSTSRGWAFFQVGDLRTAEREFDYALKAVPTFYPAEASLGFLELARKDAKAALSHFDRALELNPEYADLPTLVGRGETLLSLGREDDALGAFQAAIAADPSRTDLAQRVEVLKFRGAEQRLAGAREAARAGRLDEALQAYRAAVAASPDSPFLYRELAGVERQKGSLDAALEHFRKAVALDPSDARSQAQIGEMLEAGGDLEGAEHAYAASLAIEPNTDVARRAEGVRSRLALALTPAEYRAIDSAAQITRADLAALIGIRLPTLLQSERGAGDAALITDVRTSWAATWIMSVARAGVMEPFANHAFQPRTVVRRTDLAQAAAQLLARVAAKNPSRARAWESARPRFSDLSPNHLAYPAASVAVASGVMKADSDDSFQPSRVVTGPEAIEVIGKIEALAASR